MAAKVKPNTQIIGQNIVYFPRLDSTNTLAMELFRKQMAENGTVVYTDYQTKGRGQLKNEWISNSNENLTFSIILQPVTNHVGSSFSLNKCIALAIYHFVSELLPQEDVKIKWPNDIMVNKHKIAGILVENSFSGSQLNVSIVGVGLNVNQNFRDYPLFNAVSLFDLKQVHEDKEMVLNKLLETIDYYYLKFLKKEDAFISVDYDQNLLGYGKECHFIFGSEKLNAKIAGCDAEGRLLLEKYATVKYYMHGEIKQIIE